MRRLRQIVFTILFFQCAVFHASAEQPGQNPAGGSPHPYVFHLVQATLWDAAVASGTVYYPPTYQVDGFTHGTSNPDKLLNVANHFYPEVEGQWYCLRMTVDSLAQTGVTTIFEGTAPVGDIQPDFEGADDELFPHIMGGISPAAVLETHEVVRDADGAYVSIVGVTQP